MTLSLPVGPDWTKLLAVYEAACQRFDVEAAVACFAEDGRLEYGGESLTGQAALLGAHLWDRAAQNRIALLDPVVTGNQVAVTFQNQHELHRMLNVAPMRRPAEFVFRGDRIQLLRVLPLEPESLERLREKAGPFFEWVRQHHAEAWQRTAVLDEPGGQAPYDLAHA